MSKADAPGFDAIVVLGGPNDAMARRTAHAVALLRAGRAGTLVLCGGVVRDKAECEVMRDHALAAGVPAERILLESASRTTLENAARCREILDRRGWTRVLVVTDRLHLPRALLSFRAFGVAARGSGAATPRSTEPLRAWLGRLLYEAVGLFWYTGVILSRRHRRRAGADNA